MHLRSTTLPGAPEGVDRAPDEGFGLEGTPKPKIQRGPSPQKENLICGPPLYIHANMGDKAPSAIGGQRLPIQSAACEAAHWLDGFSRQPWPTRPQKSAIAHRPPDPRKTMKWNRSPSNRRVKHKPGLNERSAWPAGRATAFWTNPAMDGLQAPGKSKIHPGGEIKSSELPVNR